MNRSRPPLAFVISENFLADDVRVADGVKNRGDTALHKLSNLAHGVLIHRVPERLAHGDTVAEHVDAITNEIHGDHFHLRLKLRLRRCKVNVILKITELLVEIRREIAVPELYRVNGGNVKR